VDRLLDEQLPPRVRGWLTELGVEEVILVSDGAAWVRLRDCTERRDPQWGEVPPRSALARLTASAGGERIIGDATVEVRVARRGPHLAVRLAPRPDATADLAGLQRDGFVLPEVRAAIEEAIRGHRGVLFATPHGRHGGQLFEAVVRAWSERAWVHRLEPDASADAVRAARGLRPDVVALEYPQMEAWRELWLAPGPVVVRAHAPSAARAMRMVAAWMAAAHPELSLAVARELVITHVDLVLEEEADGRARGVWRVAPDEVPAVEFLAGTRARLAGSTPPEATSSPPLPSAPPASTRPRAEGSIKARFEPRRNGDPRSDWAPDSGAWPDDDTPDLFRVTDAPQPHRSAPGAPSGEPEGASELEIPDPVDGPGDRG
jgi:hypothetical protein